MKAKDAQTLSTVRSIKSAFTNLEKESGVDGISDEQVFLFVFFSSSISLRSWRTLIGLYVGLLLFRR